MGLSVAAVLTLASALPAGAPLLVRSRGGDETPVADPALSRGDQSLTRVHTRLSAEQWNRLVTTGYEPPKPTPAPPSTTSYAAPLVLDPVGARVPLRPLGAKTWGTVSAPAVPDRALMAYQRAAQVMALAAPTCHLDWTMLAAIGEVESGHGSVDGSTLEADGEVEPAIYGPLLTGGTGFARVTDSDGGLLDDSRQFDRAVGPMQILPSTWAVIGVDGDGDGVRNPQDIDDATIAAGVFLCGDDRDLATPTGANQALWAYNPDHAYVLRVEQLAADYAAAPPLTLDSDGVWDGIPAAGTYGPYAGTGLPSPATPTDPAAEQAVVDETGPLLGEDPIAATDGPIPLPTAAPTPTPAPGTWQLVDPTSAPSWGPVSSPSSSASPSPSSSPSSSSSPSPSATPSPSSSPSPSATPSPSQTPSTSPSPSETPTPTASPTASPSVSPGVGPTTGDSPTGTPTPVSPSPSNKPLPLPER